MDLSSAALFYRLIDELPCMTPQLEAELIDELQSARLGMLQAIRRVPPAWEDLLGALRSHAAGAGTGMDILDASHWGLVGGILPLDARPGLTEAIGTLETSGPSAEVMKAIRFQWVGVEILAASATSRESLWTGALLEALDRHRSVLERIVEANLRLAVRFARRHPALSPLEEMDLVQAGCEGLMSAVRRFDPFRGFRFSTYSVWWVRHTIARTLLENGGIVRIPRETLQKLRAVHRAEGELFERTGSPPSREEIASALGMSLAGLESVMSVEAVQVELDDESGPAHREAAHGWTGPFEPPEKEAQERYERNLVRSAMSVLNTRERLTIELRFGLGQEPQCSLAEIGRRFGISAERVRQLEAGAFRKLRIRLLLEPGIEL